MVVVVENIPNSGRYIIYNIIYAFSIAVTDSINSCRCCTVDRRRTDTARSELGPVTQLYSHCGGAVSRSSNSPQR